MVEEKNSVTNPPASKSINKFNKLNDERKGKTNSRVEYKSVDRKNILEIIRESIPKEMIPTKRLGYFLGAIFLVVVVIGLFKFPLGKMMNTTEPELDINLSIGEPWPFFQLQLLRPEESPIRLGGLLGDLLIYIFVAYLMDVLLNFILGASLFESEEEKKKRLVFYKGVGNGNEFSESITRKIFQPKENSNLPQQTIKTN